MAGNEFYRRFVEVFCGNSALMSRLLAALPADTARSLRGASPATRQGVNHAVESASCRLDGPSFTRDLADSFPAAHSLHVKLRQGPAGERRPTTTAVCVFLHYVASHTPKLLQKICSLDINIVEVDLNKDVRAAVTQLLQRCPSLHELSITWQDTAASDNLEDPDPSNCTFRGEGRTPDEQRASLQRQLAAITTSTAWLAPDSWPTHRCLLSLTAYGAPELPLVRGFVRGALLTPSLEELDLHCDYPQGSPHLSALQELTTLTALTNLTLACSTAFQPEERALVLPAVARLTSLRSLAVNSALLGEADHPHPGGSMLTSSLPRCWSKLAALTALRLVGCTVRLDGRPPLPALRKLGLLKDCVSWGSLAGLTGLTALTALADAPVAEHGSDDDGSEGEGGAGAMEVGQAGAQARRGGVRGDAGGVPSQWQAGLVDLHWSFRRGDMPLIVQLTALTRLALRAADACPNMFCALATLPRLQMLELPEVKPQPTADPAHSAASAFRPTFPALRHLTCDSRSCLQLLAAWTNAPPGLALQTHYSMEYDIDPNVEDGYLELHVPAWGTGWLPALFASRPCPRLVLGLVNDSAVANLVTALQALIPGGQGATGGAALEAAAPGSSSSGSRAAHAEAAFLAIASQVTAATPEPQEGPVVDIQLGAVVSAGAFRKLFEAAGRLPEGRLCIYDPEEGDGSPWLGPLPRGHFSALCGVAAQAADEVGLATVKTIKIDNCSKMGDSDLAALLAAAPALAHLVLERAQHLTDRAAYSLAVCRDLESLDIWGCVKITVKGVKLLLTVARKLAEVVVQGVHPEQVTAELQGSARWRVERMEDEGPDVPIGVRCRLRRPGR